VPRTCVRQSWQSQMCKFMPVLRLRGTKFAKTRRSYAPRSQINLANDKRSFTAYACPRRDSAYWTSDTSHWGTILQHHHQQPYSSEMVLLMAPQSGWNPQTVALTVDHRSTISVSVFPNATLHTLNSEPFLTGFISFHNIRR
jgi:hypothetical protein